MLRIDVLLIRMLVGLFVVQSVNAGEAQHEVELRAALARDVIDPHEVLQALLGESGRFHSGDHEPDGFSVEILGFDDNGDEVRLIGDYSDTGLRSVEYRGTTWKAFRHNNHCMKYEKGFPVTDDGTVNVVWENLVSTTTRKISIIDVSITGMVSNQKDWVSAGYNHGLMEFRATASSGELLIVRLRTPNDAEQLGSVISHASLWKEGQRVREIRRPVRGSSPQRLRNFDRADLQTLSKQIPNSPDAIHFWLHKDSPRHKMIYQSAGKGIQGIMTFGGMTRTKIDQSNSEPLPNLLQFEDVLLNPLIGFTPNIMKSIPGMANSAANTSPVAPIQGDMAARYWDMELGISISHDRRFISNSRRILSARSDVPIWQRALFALGVATLGRPTLLRIPKLACDDQDLLDAILASGWEFPWTSNQLDALENAARHAVDDSLFSIVVGALTSADQFERIPKDRQEIWWHAKIVSVSVPSSTKPLVETEQMESEASGSRLQTERARWPTIWKMSRYPTSRRFLKSRIDSEDPRAVRVLVLNALRMRASTALDQQRFDFMPRAECEEILAIPDLEVGGRDSEAGPARPFPTEP